MRTQRIYLEDMRVCITRIEDYIKDGQSSFFATTQIQDAVIRNFEIIGEIAKRLSPELTSQHPHIPWKQIAGFRDVLIHHYADVDLEFVWQTCETDLPPLKEAINTLLANLQEE